MMDLRKPARTPEAKEPLTQAQQNLASKYIPKALALAAPFKKKRPNDGDEIEGEALLALTQAARDYDPERGPKFVTYSHKRIEGALIRSLDKLSRSDRNVALIEETLADPHGSNQNQTAETAREIEDHLTLLHDALGQLAVDIVRRIYLQGLSIRAVALELGMSRQRVTDIHDRALQFLADSACLAA